jgi:hypothetical protein
MMNRITLIVLALLALARPARAQDPTPGQEAAARELMAAVHDSANFYTGFYRGFYGNAQRSLGQADSATVMRAVQAWAEKYIPWRELQPDFARLYSSVYTEQQMREIAAFFRGPTGQRMAAAAVQIATGSIEIATRHAAAHQAELMTAVADVVRGPEAEGKKPE